jgi:NAD-dependent SIR2 family protein deacetylase
MRQDMQDTVAQAAAIIATADGILVTAGAGMGVDSGLPDFRGDAGFWQAYPALARSQVRFAEIATPARFHTTPHVSWGFYGHRLQLYRATVPHAGFAIVRELAARTANGYFVFTSNVDGQFQQAGFDPARIVECHGAIERSQCLDGCTDAIWASDAVISRVDEDSGLLLDPLPRCHNCGGLARPNILMFNDSGWLGHVTDMQAARYATWRAGVRRLAVIELGAGTAIPSVRRFGEGQHAPLVRINPRESSVAPGRGVGLALGALDGLRALAGALR